MIPGLTQLENELLDVAKEIGPEVVDAVVGLIRSAIGGAKEEDLKRRAEQLAILTAYKASYRRGT